ncbi:MAG: MFS transporter [Bacteroidota bacterium]
MSSPVAAMSGISVVIVLIALDQTVVGTALPRIVAELQGFGLYPWVAAAYLLGNAILIPLTGRLGDLHGRKPYLLAAIALFTLASVLCGIADSMFLLVLARGLQGIGGGMLVGSAFASVTDLFPDTLQRVRWQVMLSASFGTASALGPVLGGWMTEHLGWRSVFFVNLPVGLVALPLVWRHLPLVVHADEHRGPAVDWLGVLLLTLAMGMLLLATEFAEQLGFSNPLLWGMIASALAAGAAFVAHQRRSSAPIIPPRLFADPTVIRLSLLAMLTGCVMFVLLFYAPLLLQAGFSLSPKRAGLLVTPILVCVTLGSIVNGRLIPRLARPQRLFPAGALVLAGSLALLCGVSATTPSWQLLSIFAVCGFAFGFQLPNLTIQMQAAVERRDQGAASALIQTLRTLGSMCGASLAGLIVSLGFGRGVAAVLAREGITAPQVLHLFASPQLLLRDEEQQALLQLGQAQGFDAAALLNQVRLGLVSGVHEAFFGCLLLTLVTWLLSRHLPPFVRREKGQGTGTR